MMRCLSPKVGGVICFCACFVFFVCVVFGFFSSAMVCPGSLNSKCVCRDFVAFVSI